MNEEQKPSPLERLQIHMQQGMDSVMQYGKEVVTGQKLIEGLSMNDRAFDGWMAHGSTEVANMLLHGHPAPVYARSLSPLDNSVGVQGPEQDTEVETTPQQVETSHGPAESELSFQSSIGDLMSRLQDMAPSQTPEKEMNL